MTHDNALTPSSASQAPSVFSGIEAFEQAQRIAGALVKSDLVPKEYKDNLPNALIALEMANRTGASPLMVMQNLNVVHGKPSWSSSFIIAMLNSCGRFAPVRFVLEGKGDERACYAWTTDREGNRLEGPAVSMAMARLEGWIGRSGSKWKSMPDIMLQYRAAAFFGRFYAPDILMGMHADDELADAFGPEAAGKSAKAGKTKTTGAAASILDAAGGKVKAEVTVEAEIVE